MKLENIGFYTLEDNRAKNSSISSPIWRNELIITSRCNFNCPYCRGTDINGQKGDMSFDDIKNVIDFWASENIQNVRLSGGEPTVHPNIVEIVQYIKNTCKDIKHIAISTNGYSNLSLYKELIDSGVNDYSISLDACCSSVGDMMSGGVTGSWNKVVSNIKELSKLTYITVGMVFDKQNSKDMADSIVFAHNLGVADIRIISAAQWNNFDIFKNLQLDNNVLNAHPILKYRVNNFTNGRNVRGIQSTDSRKCGLLIDDMIVKGDYHYPCVIKMREGCDPIGKITDTTVRQDRYNYYLIHDCYKDNICQQNCLDVCVDYNNRFRDLRVEVKLARLSSDLFTYERWKRDAPVDVFGFPWLTSFIVAHKNILLDYAVGWCNSNETNVRCKENQVCVMFHKDDHHFWCHLRKSEFTRVFGEIA
jgi:MoaA/NifB/PqqE/SkfB family radical SAM enzyme